MLIDTLFQLLNWDISVLMMYSNRGYQPFSSSCHLVGIIQSVCRMLHICLCANRHILRISLVMPQCNTNNLSNNLFSHYLTDTLMQCLKCLVVLSPETTKTWAGQLKIIMLQLSGGQPHIYSIYSKNSLFSKSFVLTWQTQLRNC